MASRLLRLSSLPSAFPSASSPSDSRPRSYSLHLAPHAPRRPLPLRSSSSLSSGSGSGGPASGGGGRNPGGGGGGDNEYGDNHPGSGGGLPFVGAFLHGWRSRVAADPQFPFKVLMEELVGVSSCVLGDMASRPNFGLNELDFVFSTLVVGSILNFVLMYLLAPTAASAPVCLPGLFSRCPTGHMFELGPYSLPNRAGTFIYKGAQFAVVGFFAGLAGTAISNALISLRTRLDPDFQAPNKPPPTLLNALTWAIHMGVSSNLRYQSLNGIEFVLARAASPPVFKASVVVLRCLNNILGGVSFVVLARLTGSQKPASKNSTEEKLAAEPLPVPVDGANRDLPARLEPSGK